MTSNAAARIPTAGLVPAAAAMALLAAHASEASAQPKEAEAAFKARCAECHGPRDIQHWGRQRPDAAAREAWLDQFLRRHYPPPEAERALIVAHIQAGSPRRRASAGRRVARFGGSRRAG
jgi:mono/diheme cytochrome c family protein